MKVANAVAEILKREGIEFLIGYPVNPIIEAAAEADIRTIMVRQERIGLHMCDAIAKVTSGDKIGVFAMQHGPGTENAFGGVAQSYGNSCPVVVLPAGYARNINQVRPNFNAALNYRNVTKWIEQVTVADATVEALRRAFTQVKNGRPGPVLIEFPSDLLREEIGGPLDYQKTPRLKSGPDPRSVSEIAAALVAAERPVIVAGQGIHYAKAWKQLQQLAELLEAPVMTTLPGKSAFPETHPLALGSGGIGISKQLHTFLQNADLVFGIGCSFTRSSFATPMPKGKTHRPCDLGPDRHQQGRADRTRRGRRRRADARRAVGGGQGPAARQDPRPARRRSPARSGAEGGVDGAVDAAPDPEHQAVVALSRDLGIAAHGRRQEHDHHPRRRQPARPAVAVLGQRGAALLYRLGQDDPARLRPRAGDGRQARRSPTSCASTSGATPRSA